MKASVRKPHSPHSELMRGALAIAVGAALAYGGAYLFALTRAAPEQAAPEALEVTPAVAARKPVVIEPPTAGEDPWWRGDAEFWQEQARLNSAAVAPQYRDLQLAWSQKMAANAKQRALQDPNGNQALAVPAKEAQTTELQISEKPRH